MSPTLQVSARRGPRVAEAAVVGHHEEADLALQRRVAPEVREGEPARRVHGASPLAQMVLVLSLIHI